MQCSALNHRGIDTIWSTIGEFRDAVGADGELDRHRARQATAWMWSEVRDDLLGAFRADPQVQALLPQVEADVAAGTVSPTAAARRLLDAFGS